MPNVFTTDKISNEFVNINNCAVVQLSNNDVYNQRPRGRTDYLLMYIVRGKLYAKHHDREYVVGEKQAFLYHPYEPQEYRIFKKDNTVEYWVHFNGVEMDKIIKALGLETTHHLIAKVDTFDIEQMLSRICREFNQKKTNYELICSGQLISALSLLSRNLAENQTPNTSNDFVDCILGEFHSAPQNEFVIEELAKEHNVTTNYLIKSFKKAMGETPMQYIINFRMKKAKELLLYSDYPVFKIARLVGYENNEYFSRLFRNHVGVSPLQYKKAMLKEKNNK